jgi:bile acid:Na+ symporter, BASS family
MKLLLPIAVFLLMVSIGMSLRIPDLIARWKRLRGWRWLPLLVATFLVPPAVALLTFRLLPLDFGEAVGLFMLGVVPGAPLTTRNVAKKGFDMQLAASYQVWAALLMPIMIPLVVYCSAKLYDREVWIPPGLLFKNIAENQFLPLLIGLALMYFVPRFAGRIQPAITITGNVLLAIMIVAVLWSMRAALAEITPWVIVACLILAACCMLAVALLVPGDAEVKKTLALCNSNRHIGLALLLAGDYLKARHAIPVIACYALAAPVIMILFARIARRRAAVIASA